MVRLSRLVLQLGLILSLLGAAVVLGAQSNLDAVIDRHWAKLQQSSLYNGISLI
jgi:hypothetical protein